MITNENTPIFQRADGSYMVTHNGKLCYGVGVGDEDCLYPYSEVTAYLASHPEALVDEPVPLPPTAAEIAQERIAQIKARFNAIDLETARPGRAVSLGFATLEDNDKLAALENECAGLRVELRELLA